MFNQGGRRGPDEVLALIVAGLGVWLLMSAAAAPEAKAPVPQARGHVIYKRQIIVRSVRVRPKPASQATAAAWREAKRVRCVPVKAIAGATLFGTNSVDFILKDRRRVRARLNAACPALDYYQGFYLTPGDDGMVCADRDFLRSRMGRECGIERLRVLVPARKP